MLWELRYITNLGYKSTDYTYDAMGRLVKKIYQKGTPAETFVHYYTYNDNQQIDSVFTNTTDNAATKQLQAHYVYGLMGEVKRMELGNGVQGLDYTYLLDGSLKAVNNSDKTADPGGDGSNGFLPDAFGMTLDYYTNDYLNTRSGVAKIKGVNAGSYGTDSYNGNIKAMSWYSSKPASVTGLDAPTTNVFKYDDHYRFTENTWGTGLNFANSPASFTATTYNKEKIVNPTNPQAAGYDSHGNILSLQRTNTTGQLVDNFTYNYKPNSNELATVVNSATGTAQTYASYSYDSLGQLIAENTEDTSKTKYLKYDVTGKVVLVARDAAFSRKVAEFVYDETGARIAKKSYNTAGQLVETTWYTGDAIYIQTTGAAVPEEYAIDGGAGRIGTFYRQDNVYAYELRDQTGNVRAVVAKSGSSLEVRGYSDYYPYGMVLRSGGTDYRYGYQGAYAEKDGETDWNAFELRMYDSRIARWLTTDPAGQYYSPYIAMGNDPVNNIDKNGGESGPGDDCPNCLATVTVYAQVQRPVNISHLDGININVNLWQQSLVKIKAPQQLAPTPKYDAYTQSWADFNRMGSEVREKGHITYPESLNKLSDRIISPTINLALTLDGVNEAIMGTKALLKVAAKKVGSLKIPIYRVYGDGASMYGKSYSLINPEYVPFYRNFAGLPEVNSGQYLLKGSIPLRDIKIGRWFAAPLDGNTGGLPFELYQNYNQLINPSNAILTKPF